MASGSTAILIAFLEVTLDSATYSCPCANTGVSRKIPKWWIDCPWAFDDRHCKGWDDGELLTLHLERELFVIVLSVKDDSGDEDVRALRKSGHYNASMLRSRSDTTRNRAPLHSPASLFRLRIIMIGVPTIKTIP
ncbi:hypothetical protein PRNP1_000780 [Phytophthora ramorum]